MTHLVPAHFACSCTVWEVGIWYSRAVHPTRPLERVDTSANDSSEVKRFVCDLCSKTFRGTPGGSGLFMWTRGEEVRTEEPPLCTRCATKLTLRALAVYDDEAGGEE